MDDDIAVALAHFIVAAHGVATQPNLRLSKEALLKWADKRVETVERDLSTKGLERQSLEILEKTVREKARAAFLVKTLLKGE